MGDGPDGSPTVDLICTRRISPLPWLMEVVRGEVRRLGVFANRADVVRKMVERLKRRAGQLRFCYEAVRAAMACIGF
jgi:hypothetical protein